MEITVVAIAGKDPEGNEKAILQTASKIPYNCKKILCSVFPPKNKDIKWVKIDDWGIGFKNFSPKLDYFFSRRLIDYITTEHIVMVQADGYAINSNRWTDDFLEWDYIGAPLPIWETWCIKGCRKRRVGSGGFNLRSRKFFEVELECEVNSTVGEDIYVTRIKHEFFESRGCKYAPIDIALKWCFEHQLEDYPNWSPDYSFGVHGITFDNKFLHSLSPFRAFLFAVKKSIQRRCGLR